MKEIERQFPPNLPPEVWQKIVVILMKKHGLSEVKITGHDIESLNADGKYPVLGTHFHADDALTILLFDDIKDAEAYTKAHPEGRRAS